MKDAVARLTPLGLMVLALLSEGDMHPYEMIRLMRLRRDERLVTITNGTMYHTVARLQREGLLSEVGVDRDGNRPERTTYAVTDAGARAVADWLRRELVRTDHPAQFRIALAQAHHLPRGEVVDLLHVRRAALSDALAEHRTAWERAVTTGVPPQYLLERDRESTLLASDLDWLDALILRIAAADFPWEEDGPPTERYLAQRKAARQ